MLSPARTLTLYRFIALTEILGVGWSVTAMALLLLRTPGVEIPWSFLLGALAAYSIVAIGGVLLWRGRELGRVISISAQVIQALQVTSGPVAFRFLAGPQVTVFFLGDRFTTFAGLSASVNVWRGRNDPTFVIGVNLVALGIVVLLVCFRGSSELLEGRTRSDSRAPGA